MGNVPINKYTVTMVQLRKGGRDSAKRQVSAYFAAALTAAAMFAFSECGVIGRFGQGATDAALEDVQSVDPNITQTKS